MLVIEPEISDFKFEDDPTLNKSKSPKKGSAPKKGPKTEIKNFVPPPECGFQCWSLLQVILYVLCLALIDTTLVYLPWGSCT